MSSLKSRFTKATIAILILFSLALAGLLNKIFRQTLITSEQSRLQGLTYTYLSAMDVTALGAVNMDQSKLIDTITDTKNISVYILDENQKTIWGNNKTSPQIFNDKIPKTGEWLFEYNPAINNPMILKFGLTWEFETTGKEWKYTIITTDSGLHFQNEMKNFQKTLWKWLILGGLLLLLLLLVLVHWGLLPLLKIAQEVESIEKGKQHTFESTYPNELSPLISNINSLLRHERSQQIRYQYALDNLAHALKTPLTAIKNMTMQKTQDHQLQKDLNEQVMRAKDIVDYQLRKAATVGRNPFAKPIQLLNIVEKTSRSIQKVYAQKNIKIEINIHKDATIPMDEGDLFEVTGNIIENAAKYCSSKIKITFNSDLHKDLIIEDDGQGFSDQNIQSITQRGVRQDQRLEGSGIGLSVAHEIISVFGGSLELTRSPSLGGALVKIRFY